MLVPVAIAFFICAVFFHSYVQDNIQLSYSKSRDKQLENNILIIENIMEGMRDIFKKSKQLILFYSQSKKEAFTKNNFKSYIEESMLWKEINAKFDIDEFWAIEESSFDVLGKWSDSDEFLDKKVLLEKIKDKQKWNYDYIEFIECVTKCKYYNFALVEGVSEKPVIFLLGIDINYLVESFMLLSKSDIAVVSKKILSGQKQNDVGYSLKASSNYLSIYSVLIKTDFKAVKAMVNNVNINYLYVLNGEREDWELSSFPSEVDGFILLLLNNVTSEKNELRQSRKKAFLIMFIGFSGLLLLVFILVNHPLKRLRTIGNAIPLLGVSQFSLLRKKIGKPKHFLLGDDEVGLIHSTAYTVSHHLELLELNLKTQSIHLNEALEKVSIQHNFLKELLDNSQILVLTLDEHYRVTLNNQLVMRYSLLETSNLVKKSLFEVFDQSVAKCMVEHIQSLSHSFNSQTVQQPIQHELEVFNDNHQLRWVSWLHCYLTVKTEEENTVYLSIGMDITARKEAEQRIKRLAEMDSLTNLYNRRTFTEKAQQAIMSNLANNKQGALLYIDLDKFKQINDLFGHQVGDDYLTAVADILRSSDMYNIITGRLGGDELAVFVSSTNIESIIHVAEGIIKRIRTIALPDLKGFYNSGASLGIALSPQHGNTIQDLLQHADRAMYSAKSDDSKQIILYNPDMLTLPTSKFERRSLIARLLLSQQLDINIQPIIALAHGGIIGYECLTRVNHSQQHGGISTQQLFEYAESCGMATELDLHIINKIFSTLDSIKSMQDSYSYQINRPFYITINVSAKSVVSADFLTSLLMLCREYSVDLSNVVFEITETAFLSDLTLAAHFINTLKKRGALVAIDDFGAGYSGLKLLRALSFDWIKIDGEFITNIANNVQDQIIVASIIQTATKMNLKVVVEFVENSDVYEYFEKNPVDMLQGYYVGEPRAIQLGHHVTL